MSETKDLIKNILRTHRSSVVANRSNGRTVYDAVCKACAEPLPWGEDARERAVIDHQASVIAQAVAARVERVEALAEEWERSDWHAGNPRADCATVAARRIRVALSAEVSA